MKMNKIKVILVLAALGVCSGCGVLAPGPKTETEYVKAFHELVAEKTDVERRLDQLINTWPNCPSKAVQLSPFGTPVCKVVEAAGAGALAATKAEVAEEKKEKSKRKEEPKQ